MEALAAIGLAAGVLQFVDFTGKTVLRFIELHKSGRSTFADHDSAESATLRLGQITKTLSSSTNCPNTPSAIEAIAQECLSDDLRLYEALKRIEKKPNGKWWDTVYKAARSVWDANKIGGLQERLDRYRLEICTHLLVSHQTDLVNIANSIKMLPQESAAQHNNVLLAIQTLETTQRDSVREVAQQIQVTETVVLSAIQRLVENAMEARLQNILQKMDTLSTKGDPRQPQLDRHSDIVTTEFSHVEVDAAQRFLDDLHHPLLFQREKQIQSAEKGTYEWIFCEHDEERTLDGNPAFVEWLQSDMNLYWITGKPGSGKSTLMKHIANDARTEKSLRVWAQSSELVIASAFIWISGQPLQKSCIGLLRSLLFQILDRRRDLISKLFPREWRLYQRRNYEKTVWMKEELKEAVDMFQISRQSSHKFCLFIDGLDEYEDESELEWLCDFLIKLSTADWIKLCVSSRPWADFERAFADQCRIRLQDWTEADIRTFVKQQLQGHPYWSEIETIDPLTSRLIIDELSQGADGVFLWVFFAVQSIKNGLKRGDTATRLLVLVEELPAGLENYFQRMFSNIDPQDREKIARVLPFTHIWSEHALRLFHFHYSDQDGLFGQDAKCSAVPLHVLEARAIRTKRFLENNFKDIFSLGDFIIYPDDLQDEIELFGSNNAIWNMYKPVQYIHRSVKDYLATTEARRLLQTPIMDIKTAYHYHYQSILAEVKVMSSQHIGKNVRMLLRVVLRDFSRHNTNQLDNEYLDDLSDSVEMALGSGLSKDVFYILSRDFTLLQTLAISGCNNYVRYKLEDNNCCMDLTELWEIYDALMSIEDYVLTDSTHYELVEILNKTSKSLYVRGVNDQYYTAEVRIMETLSCRHTVQRWCLWSSDGSKERKLVGSYQTIFRRLQEQLSCFPCRMKLTENGKRIWTSRF